MVVRARRPPPPTPEQLAEMAKDRVESRVTESRESGAVSTRTKKVQEAAPIKAPEIIYDSTNERMIICAQIADAAIRKKLVRSISPDELLVPEHVAMHRALRIMEEHKLDYDGETFRRLIADEGVPVDDSYLEAIERDAVVPPNLDWRVETLRWDATRARLVRGPVPELIKAIRDPKASAETLQATARAILRGLEGGSSGRRYVRRTEELKRSYKADITVRRAAGNFYPTYFEAIDAKLVEGIMPKRTSLLVGLSGSGKSTFTSSLVRNLAENGRRVLFGAWEMGTESVLDVMVAQLCRIEIERVVQGELSDEEIPRVNDAIDWLTDHITFMDNAFFGIEGKGRQRASNDQSLDIWEGYIAESGCDVVVSDLWERCLVDLSYDGVTKALYKQQDMYARYNVHGMLVHQIKLKEVEQRPDKRPTRDSIKGSGAFVEVPDLVFGIHRDAQFKSVPDDSIEAICLKQRKGKAFWSTRFDWFGSMGLITGGEEVPYNPGLDSSSEFGDIGDIKVDAPRRRKPSRRD